MATETQTAAVKYEKSKNASSKTKRPFPKKSASQLSTTTRRLATPDSIENFTFTWPVIQVGDCTLSGSPELIVWSDGTVVWEATVSSSSGGGDVWLATFSFYDDHGIQLWQFGTIDSPQMDVAGLEAFWLSDNQLYYPAYLYPYITNANLHSHC